MAEPVTMTVRDALNAALDEALASDERVLVMGEDVADPAGGVSGVTRGLSTKHGADRAAAYAMPGERVDGNDPVALFAAMAGAVDRAREGGGPTLLECLTYRFNGHFFGDPMSYIPKEELERAIAADPVPRYRAWLISSGAASDADLASVEAQAVAEVESALSTVLASPPPGLEELDRDVYAGAV